MFVCACVCVVCVCACMCVVCVCVCLCVCGVCVCVCLCVCGMCDLCLCVCVCTKTILSHTSSCIYFGLYTSTVILYKRKNFLICCDICSAGVGRTGTFITLDVMMKRLKERGDLNIFDFVTEMRTRRTQMVQAPVSN